MALIPPQRVHGNLSLLFFIQPNFESREAWDHKKGPCLTLHTYLRPLWYAALIAFHWRPSKRMNRHQTERAAPSLAVAVCTVQAVRMQW